MASIVESPLDFYKSQIQVQIIKSKQDPLYKRESCLLVGNPHGEVAVEGLGLCHTGEDRLDPLYKRESCTSPALSSLSAYVMMMLMIQW